MSATLDSANEIELANEIESARGVAPLRLRLGVLFNRVNDDEFFEFCMRHKDLRIERTSEGDLDIMTPTGGTTGRRNFSLTSLFGIWVEQDGTGVGFDSSTNFRLPNGAVRSPNASWVRGERWNALTSDEQEVFPPLCPDFVIELRSQTDSLAALKRKMEEYIANDAQLGWLIDPKSRCVFIYRPGQSVERLDNPQTLAGDPLLPGFVLNVTRL